MADDSTRSRGTVRWFDNQKGFGFISPDDGGEDLFVHQSAIKSDGFRTLQESQVVEFSVILENDRTKAIDVTGPEGSSLDEGRKDDFVGGRGGRTGFGSRTGGFGSNNGGFRRNGGGGGGGGGCYVCGEAGHLARDCRRQGSGGGGGGGGGGACFNCGSYGHLARDCNNGRSGGGGGGGGRGGGGGGGACYNCGGQGHLARECPSGGGGGAGGGRYGGGGGGGGNSCYNCGEQGHFARECPNNAGA